ncbi:hypothetical protein P7C70_g2184, partial [Phenoliferia sp. Uapishka_3]
MIHIEKRPPPSPSFFPKPRATPYPDPSRRQPLILSPPRPPIPLLPIEIIQMTINQLNVSTSQMSVLSIVNKALFLDAARAVLFREVTIVLEELEEEGDYDEEVGSLDLSMKDQLEPSRSPQAFLETTSAFPHLRLYVRTIYLIIRTDLRQTFGPKPFALLICPRVAHISLTIKEDRTDMDKILKELSTCAPLLNRLSIRGRFRNAASKKSIV